MLPAPEVRQNHDGVSMNPSDPLAQLRDIHLPADISNWPMAPGWWLLIIATVSLLGWLIWLLIKRYRARLYRRQAILKITQLQQAQRADLLPALFATLKQTANSAYPEQYFSSLSTNDFIAFMQSSCKQPLLEDLPSNLDKMLYAEQPEIDSALAEQLISSAIIWIEQHQTKVAPAC
jgi:hypothetical protein